MSQGTSMVSISCLCVYEISYSILFTTHSNFFLPINETDLSRVFQNSAYVPLKLFIIFIPVNFSSPAKRQGHERDTRIPCFLVQRILQSYTHLLHLTLE